jgi:hypothetical protein
MATDDELLHRWAPKLCYDSLEAFFADHPAQMVVNPGNTLRRAPSGGSAGQVIAAAAARPGAPAPPPAVPLLWWDDGGAPPEGTQALSLGWPRYSDETRGEAGDRLSISGREYRTQYVALRKRTPELRNKIVARAVRDPDTGQLWLQYWFWYFYNDYHLAFNAGLHEGDWEMIQLGLEADEPVVAVYAQHDVAERRPWDRVKRTGPNGETPLVFAARGSHASYFEPGLYETTAWFDVTDGKRSAKQTELIVLGDKLPGWAAWQGRWGDTEPRVRGLHTPSPEGPVKHGNQWSHPQRWADTAVERRTPRTAADAPEVQVARVDDHVVLEFDFTRLGAQAPAVIVVNVNSPSVRDEPPRSFTFDVQDQRAGRIVTSIALVPGQDYDVRIAVNSRDGVPSAPLLRFLPARGARPKTTVASRVGAFLGRVVERLRSVLPGGRGGGEGP